MGGDDLAEAEELALAAVVVAVLVVERGGEARRAVAPVAALGGDAAHDPAALRQVVGVARAGVVYGGGRAEGRGDAAEEVGLAYLAEADGDLVVLVGLNDVRHTVAVYVHELAFGAVEGCRAGA